MYPEFINELKKQIDSGLPGWEAQKRMAPMGRSPLLYKPLSEKKSRESGVLIWLYPNEDKIFTRLILRTVGGIHSGQVAFPGGKVEPTDSGFWNTALREANEEIGLSPDKITKIGALTPLYIPPSNFWVHPFIGFSEKQESAVISKAEVQTYFDVEIIRLIQPELKQEGLITLATGEQKITQSYILDGRTVWGALQ
jgi:8-oxo-dGTP pyrophosphatase MutT (NUDIX family)